MTPHEQAVIEAAKRWTEVQDGCYSSPYSYREKINAENGLAAAVAALREAERKEV